MENLIYVLVFLLFCTIVLIELKLKPRLDKTIEGDLILWYNSGWYSKERHYIIL